VEEHPLSHVGLGAWAFGGVGWGPQDDRDSIAAIHRAVELGVNWIDTAAVYGDGHAELIVGKALATLPAGERPLVFTKAGVRIDPDTAATYRDLSPASLRTECEASLKRLGLERIDLYQLHWPVDDPGIVEQAWETLGELQREGKVRWAGVSNFDVALLERCARIRTIDSVQLPLSLLNRQATESALPWAAAHGVPAIAYSPLESGLLSGSFSLERLAALPADDWRKRRVRFQAPQVERALELVELLRPITVELGISLVELAIAWTLHWSGVTSAIVGARSPEQVEGWIGAGGLTLPDTVLGRIEATLAQVGAGEGPLGQRSAQVRATNPR
jgi:aryl-alcohol dehydrogenase-like predicted oxidoreductase